MSLKAFELKSNLLMKLDVVDDAAVKGTEVILSSLGGNVLTCRSSIRVYKHSVVISHSIY
jgi:hypothetical protein